MRKNGTAKNGEGLVLSLMSGGRGGGGGGGGGGANRKNLPTKLHTSSESLDVAFEPSRLDDELLQDLLK